MISLEEPDIAKVKEHAEAWRTQLDLAWRASPSGSQRDMLDLERTLASDDWTGLSALIQRAIQPGDCPRINFAERIQELGFAQELAKKLEEILACDPLDADIIYRLAWAYSIAGRPEKSLGVLNRPEAARSNSTRFRTARLYAQVVAGRFDGLEMQSFWAPDVLQHLIEGNQAEAHQAAERLWADPDFGTLPSLRLAAIVGDCVRANGFAARIDKYQASAFLLIPIGDRMIFGRLAKPGGCRHGMPFDLEATPNFKARIKESGLQWPPAAFRDASVESLK